MAEIKHYSCDCGYELNVWDGPNYMGTDYHRVLRCKNCGEYQVVCEEWHPYQKLRPVDEYSCDFCGTKGEMREVTEEEMYKGLICPVCGTRMIVDGCIEVD